MFHGILRFSIDGVSEQAKGSFTIGFGVDKREAIVGADAVHGVKVTPQVPYIEGAVTLRPGLKVKQLMEAVGKSILVEGRDPTERRSYMLADAYYAGDGTLTTEEGEIPVRFEGSRLEEA